MSQEIDIKKIIEQFDIKNQGDENVFLISHSILQKITSYNIQYDGFITILITKGHASLKIDNTDIKLKARDFLVLKQKFFIEESTYSPDIEFKAIYISKKIADDLIFLAHINWSLYASFDTYFKTTFSKEDTKILCLYFEILQKRIFRETASKNKVVTNLLRKVFIYDIISIIEQYINTDVRINSHSGNTILENFFILITNTHPTPRNVAWYAQELHITPKYLSTFCHKNAGKSPSKIINEEIYRQAIDLLRNSNHTISQISEKLGFNNQSHFGTFMRRMGGISPKEIRKT
ncbi:MAG: AraC family transcriptional regulator [Bacteroidales bacterium]|nr:AraC family transcriptional regulator [Bacteroidales bacterium]